jgi:altronate dehydratase large subunit
VVVVYLVECAHHVAREIALPYRDQGVHVLGFGGCYPNDYSQRMLGQLCTHPNVGAVLLVSLGCEGFDRAALQAVVAASGRPVELIHIQNTGGTRKSCERGRTWVTQALADLAQQARVPMAVEELIVGTICGGSDSTSGITANPAIGLSFDRLVKAGATVMFEETGELIGCEDVMAARAKTPELGQEIVACVEKAARYYTVMGHGSFAPGFAEGGLTTQ